MTDEGLIMRLAIRHSVSADAVRIVLGALRSGNGRMAQFSHADFGGMSQWSPGMTMVGDMFNNELKAKLDAICTELACHVTKEGSRPNNDAGRDNDVSYRVGHAKQPMVAGRSRNSEFRRRAERPSLCRVSGDKTAGDPGRPAGRCV